METGVRRIGVAERRARLAVRHHLALPARAGTAAAVAQDLIALHGTDPASVYLAVWARTSAVDGSAVEQALYTDRALVRMLGMRRTMFVVPAGSASLIQAACTDEIAGRMRRTLTGSLQKAEVAEDVPRWLTEVCDATVAALTTLGSATGAELAKAEPRLGVEISYAEGKNYGGATRISSRVLMLLSAEGRIIRGRPRGGWTSSQFQWYLTGAWLDGRPAQTYPSAAQARAELARRWLHAFGPAPVSDLQWWAGWTAGQTKAALAGLDLTEVDLDGTPGVLLAADAEPGRVDEPWAALLPALDPTPMGWKDRSWFLGGHAPALFDRSGNIGPTIWWDGRIVGGWAQRKDGEVVCRLLEDAGADAQAAIAAQVELLTPLLGAARVTPRFRTPLERELTS
ncbi:MAG TPA: winged helix DNA-binding domain-containing protein [Streptosporangiaceae bacterium]